MRSDGEHHPLDADAQYGGVEMIDNALQNAIKGVTWKCVPYMPDPPQEV